MTFGDINAVSGSTSVFEVEPETAFTLARESAAPVFEEIFRHLNIPRVSRKEVWERTVLASGDIGKYQTAHKLTFDERPEYNPDKLSYHLDQSTRNNDVVAVVNMDGWRFLYVHVTKNIKNYVKNPSEHIVKGRIAYTATVITDLTNVIWYCETYALTVEEASFAEFTDNVLTPEGLQRAWDNHIPDTGPFLLTESRAFEDTSLTTAQADNFFRQASNFGKAVASALPNLSAELYYDYALNLQAWTDDYDSMLYYQYAWTKILSSPHRNVDVVLKALKTHYGQQGLQQTFPWSSKDTVLFEAVKRVEGTSAEASSFFLEQKPDKLPARVWAYVNRNEKSINWTSFGGLSPHTLTLAWLLEAYKTLMDAKIHPVWLDNLVHIISRKTNGATILTHLLVEEGIIDGTLLNAISDEFVLELAGQDGIFGRSESAD